MSIINGSSKNDVLKSLAEDDDLTGGEAGIPTGIFNGVDTALFSGKYADSTTGVVNYSLTAAYDASFGYYLGVTDNNSADGVDGSDRVRADIEIVRFTDSASADSKPTFLSLTQEMVANGLTAGNQTNTTVLALANGGFLNFWLSGDGFYFRKFNNDTTSDSFETKLLDSVSDSLSSDITVANFNDGSFVVAWSSPDADGTGVYAQRFNADGAAVSPKFRVNDTITADQGSPAIAVLSDGGFVVTWVSENQGDSVHEGQSFGDEPNQSGVFAQWYDASTVPVPIGWEVKVSDSGAAHPFVSALDNNRVVIGYEGIASGTEKMTMHAKIFDDYGNVESYLYGLRSHPDIVDGSGPGDGYDAYDGQLVPFYADDYAESPFNINYAIEPKKDIFDRAGNEIENELRQETKNAVAATLTLNHKTVVVWQAPVDPYLIVPPTGQARVDYDRSIMLRLYDNATGEALTQEIKANTFTRYDQREPAVAALKDGGFVVVWQSMLQDNSYRGIYGQKFDNDGNKVGDEFQINTKVADSQKEPSVTGLDDGGFIVSWVAEYQDGNQEGKYQNGLSGTEIIMQRFDKDGNKMALSVAGGVDDDILNIGGSLPIQMDGAAGNDRLTAGDGRDTLRGGDGNDVLDAGKGNDFMVGGTGDDRFIAGEGNDFVYGGAGSDTLVLLGSKLDYEVKKVGSSFTVRSLNASYADMGTDTLQGIEYLEFAVKTGATDDGIISLNSFGSGGTGGTSGNIDVAGIELSDFDLKQANTLSGTDKNDTLAGGNTKGAPDTLQAGNGDDLYIALGNALIIYDSGGNDTLQVSTINVDLSQSYNSKNKIKGLQYIENVELAGKKALKLVGNAENNILIGNDGNNKIVGGAGSDIISGGKGKDTLTGGNDGDIFVFKDILSKSNVDLITDFQSGTDKIRLSSVIFKNLDPDNDGIINFESAPGLKRAQTDTASFIVYDTKSGKLYYDEAGKSAVLFAKLAATGDGGQSSGPAPSEVPSGGFGASSGSGQNSSGFGSGSGSGSGSVSPPEVVPIGTKTFPDLLVADFELLI
jgi:serralysin